MDFKKKIFKETFSIELTQIFFFNFVTGYIFLKHMKYALLK